MGGGECGVGGRGEGRGGDGVECLEGMFLKCLLYSWSVVCLVGSDFLPVIGRSDSFASSKSFVVQCSGVEME